jgi:hypothetical protein
LTRSCTNLSDSLSFMQLSKGCFLDLPLLLHSQLFAAIALPRGNFGSDPLDLDI